MEQIAMKEKPIFRLVFTMSMPNVLSMLVNSMYNIVDSFFVAKINENAMTALSLGQHRIEKQMRYRRIMV